MFKAILKSTLIATTLAAAATVANAAPVVFDRGLPTANLNDTSGAARSNVSWGYGAWSPTYYSGDDFTLSAGSQWKIDTLRVWATIGRNSALSPSLIAERYSSISLYGGADATLVNLMSGNTVGNGTDNANITISQVHYVDGSDYDSFGNQLNLFQFDFHNLNWVVDGGVTQYFSVAGVDNASEATYRPFFMHASNAALGGPHADGADDRYAAFYDNGAGGLTFDGLENSGAVNGGWDKSSDINVQVEATKVPEPASIALFGAALLGLCASRRKRGAKR